jgi:chorismate mutase
MLLEKLRQEVDNLDKELVKLLNERVKISFQILQEKQKLKLPIYNPHREEQVIQKVVQENKGPLTADQIGSIFQLIIESCRIHQQNQKGNE